MMRDFVPNVCITRRLGCRMRGFSLVSAIFLLVVLAALGVAIVSISSVQNQSSALDIQGVRAYQAARAGVEWGLYQQQHGSCAGSSTVPLSGTLSAFTVTVTCSLDTGAGLNINNWVITATACNNSCTAGGNGFVKRVVEVRL